MLFNPFGVGWWCRYFIERKNPNYGTLSIVLQTPKIVKILTILLKINFSLVVAVKPAMLGTISIQQLSNTKYHWLLL